MTYTLTITRTLTVDADDAFTVDELLEVARDELHADSALWNVEIDGKTYPLTTPFAQAQAGHVAAFMSEL